MGIQNRVATGQKKPTVQELEPGATAFPTIAPHVAQHKGKIAVQLPPEPVCSSPFEDFLQTKEVQVGWEEGRDLMVKAVVSVTAFAPNRPFKD